MATDSALLEHPPPAPVDIPPEQRFVFDGISWNQYLNFDGMLADRRYRMTYDRGYLELMTVSWLHERVKLLMDRLLFALTDELNIDSEGGGSTTFRRADLERGIEPDQCYYIQNAGAVAGRDKIDLTVDPPPDLVIEVEISRSILDRLDVLAALKVPEIWCVDDQSARFLRLGTDGEYVTSGDCLAIPDLKAEHLVQFLRMRSESTDREIVNACRQWVREQWSIEE